MAGLRLKVSGCIRVHQCSAAGFSLCLSETGSLRIAPGGFPDPLERVCLGAVYAFRVHLQQHGNAVAGPLGNLGWIAGGAQPGRDGGVSEAVRNLHERRSGFLSSEGGFSRFMEYPKVRAVRHRAAVHAHEQSGVGGLCTYVERCALNSTTRSG